VAIGTDPGEHGLAGESPARKAGFYNQSRYEKEVGEALQMLADWMDGLGDVES
jgi:hypothetical protein